MNEIRAKHYVFPPPERHQLDNARARGVPDAVLEFYELCDGALIGAGSDFSDPNGRQYRLRIPHLAEVQSTQSYGYIFDDSPLFTSSACWWQIVDYCDANWLAYDGTPASPGRIMNVYHETVGELGSHEIVASSIPDLLERLLDRGGVYWFDGDFHSLGAI
ncbi:MAG: hypothetical protein U0795_17640 [Pirellulales bacterium]